MLKDARNDAGLSRDIAAMRLNVCSRTLYDIENKDTAAPEIVLKMAEVYGKPDLPARYCSDICPIGQVIAHRYQQDHMAVMVLTLLKKFENIERLKSRMIGIAADGYLAEEEKPEFLGIMRELTKLERQIGELKQFAARNGICLTEIMPRKEKAPVRKPELKINFC